MGEIVAQVRHVAQGSPTLQSGTTSSTLWYDWVVETATTNVPTDECATLQSEIDAAIQECKSFLDSLLNGAKVAGIVIGNFASLSLIVAGSYYAYQQYANRRSNPNVEDVAMVGSTIP